MNTELWQKGCVRGWPTGISPAHCGGESEGWRERAASCCRANCVLRSRSSHSTWGWEAKIALIRGRLIYSLCKHLHGYFLINHTKSLIPQYLAPNISQPSLGVHTSSRHSWKPDGAQGSIGLPAPRTLEVGWEQAGHSFTVHSFWGSSETGETREEIPRFLTATVRKQDIQEV